MNFTEFTFWWLLAVVAAPLLAGRWVAARLSLWNESYDRVVLLVLSSVLFWSASATSFAIHIVELLMNYAAFRAFPFVSRRGRYVIGGAAIAVDLSVLAYFKYAGAVPAGGLPPGISFYTFQVVAFMIDTMRAPSAMPTGLLDYLNFASFFPLVVAGPIERRDDLLPQMSRFRWRYRAADVDEGLRWIAAGAFIKFVLADNLAAFVRAAETGNPWLVLMSVYLFGLRIYFDFAGYSFIALGLGRALGVKLTVNFLAPYSSTSIVEFWRRWHVTLSQWFRDYIYIPLGGSRGGLVALNLMIVFVISGIWHGAGWNYVMWGAYHGALLIGARWLGRWIRLPRQLAWFVTFNAVMLGWLLFMETDTARLAAKAAALATPVAYSAANLRAAIEAYSPLDRAGLLVSLALASAVLLLERRRTRDRADQPYAFLLEPAVACTLLASTFLLSARYFSPFVYFRF